MISNVSPNVNIREFDLSISNPDVLPFSVATVGEFIWGPCFKRKQVTTEAELLRYFGKPTDLNYENWFNCSEFLRYGSNLWIVRVVDSDTAKNAGITVTNDAYGTSTLPLTSNPYIPSTDIEPTVTFSTNEKLKFFAKYPGTYGNEKIKISLATAADFSTANVNSSITYKSIFEYAPTTSAYDYYDQVAIVIQVQNDADDNWNIVEKFIVDLDPSAKDSSNRSNYIENVINIKSNYIYVYDNETLLDMPNSFEETYLAGGVNSVASVGDFQSGYDLFANEEEFNIRFIIDGGNTDPIIQKYIIGILSNRLDTFGILCVPKSEMVDIDISTAVSNCIVYKNVTLNESTSYAALYANAKRMYDRYNDKFRWISMSGDVAGIYIDTLERTNSWTPPAGDISKVKNVNKLAMEPNLSQRDTLYIAQVNPIISKYGAGVQIYGQKTMQSFPSAFDRVNVRLLFLELETVIKNSAIATLFKINDAFQRNLFILQVTPKLDQVQSEGGIYEYKIVCDDTNNTPQIIDTNNFVADIYIKPARAIEFININFTAVATGIDITEIIR